MGAYDLPDADPTAAGPASPRKRTLQGAIQAPKRSFLKRFALAAGVGQEEFPQAEASVEARQAAQAAAQQKTQETNEERWAKGRDMAAKYGVPELMEPDDPSRDEVGPAIKRLGAWPPLPDASGAWSDHPGMHPGPQRGMWEFRTDPGSPGALEKKKSADQDRAVAHAIALGDPSLVPEDHPQRDELRRGIANQDTQGAPQAKELGDGSIVWVVPPPVKKHPGARIPPLAVPPKPSLDPGMTPQPPGRDVDPGMTTKRPSGPSGPAMGGGSRVIPITDASGAPVTGKMPQGAMGLSQQIANARDALGVMKGAYERNQGVNLERKTLGAAAAGLTDYLPSLRGEVQTRIPSADDAQMHENNRGTVAALATRVLTGTARGQWIAQQLEKTVPHFTDTPKVAGNFYDEWGRFLDRAEKMPWAGNPKAAQQQAEDDLLGVVTRVAASQGKRLDPAPPGVRVPAGPSAAAPRVPRGTGGGARPSLDDIWQKVHGNAGP